MTFTMPDMTTELILFSTKNPEKNKNFYRKKKKTPAT